MAETQQFCTFYLDKYFFGVEVEKVQEVLRYQEMTRVPLAPHAIKGLINLRGQIVTAIDLRTTLEFPDRRRDQLPMNVVVRTEDGGVSLLVDEIGDVLETDQATFESVPDTMTGISRQLIRGIHKLKEGLLLVLDTEKAISLSGSDEQSHQTAAGE